MKDDMRNLIRAVVQNRYSDAKKFCRIIVENDKTEKEKRFCENMLHILTAQGNLIELPHDVKNVLYAEEVTANFNEKRYFLSEREKSLFEKIMTMTNTSAKLQEMGIRYLNSTLLYGESRTGKTMFGKYVAYKMGKPFYYMNFSNTISSYLGSTGKNIHTAFDFVKGQECVFMLDEIDAVGIRRGDGKEVGEMGRIVISLMQEFDMLGNDVVLLAATNRRDILDEALLGRFSLKHEVRRFDASEMESMIRGLLLDIGMIATESELSDYVAEKDKNGVTQGSVMNDVVNRIAKAVENNTTVVEFGGGAW